MKKILVLVILAIFSLSAEVLVSDDFESGTGNWTLTGNWGLEEGTSVSGNYSLTESPNENYTANNTSIAKWSGTVNLNLYTMAVISFKCKFELEDQFDFMHFEVSDNNGFTWDRIRTWTGESADWYEEKWSLFDYLGYSEVKFRFVFTSDSGNEENGMYIDDIIITASNTETAYPLIVHNGPEYYEGNLNEYESSADVYDYSGVDSVWVEYYVDNGPTFSVTASNTMDYFWEFIVPSYGAGSQIDYRIFAKESSTFHLESISRVFSYIEGEYMKYDSGIISGYRRLEMGQAMAVKISTDFMDHPLAFILIRNYEDYSDGLGKMKLHVWADEGGLPGYEMMEPFEVWPEALLGIDKTAFTRVDLRDKIIYVQGDFWIGISAYEMNVLAITESPHEEGTTAYERSYYGVFDGSEWSWSLDADYNYEFRAILGVPTGIEDTSIPSVTELHQNYPNPFNPETSIKYSLSNDAQVKLTVYDIAGREAARLVSEKQAKGNYDIKFNGGNMTSGLYFYRLDVDGKTVQSRKMMLLK